MREMTVALGLMAFALSLCFLGGCVSNKTYKRHMLAMFDVAYEMGAESCYKTKKQTKDYREACASVREKP